MRGYTIRRTAVLEHFKISASICRYVQVCMVGRFLSFHLKINVLFRCFGWHLKISTSKLYSSKSLLIQYLDINIGSKIKAYKPKYLGETICT